MFKSYFSLFIGSKIKIKKRIYYFFLKLKMLNFSSFNHKLNIFFKALHFVDKFR